MKRLFLLPLAAGILLSSCDTTTKDDSKITKFREYNLIVSEGNENPAVVSPSIYQLDFSSTRGTVAVSTANLLFGNTNHSFETDTIRYGVYGFKDGEREYYQGRFSSMTDTSRPNSPSITRLSGVITLDGHYVSTPVPGFSTYTEISPRLLLDYTYNDAYRIRTFWRDCFYRGVSVTADSNGEPYSTSSTVYRIVMDIENLTAQCVVYAPEFSAGDAVDANLPIAMLIGNIAIKLDHDTYHLEASAPPTAILTRGSGEFLVSGDWKVSDFRFDVTSSDLTRGLLTYRLGDRDIRFAGASVPTPSY